MEDTPIASETANRRPVSFKSPLLTTLLFRCSCFPRPELMFQRWFTHFVFLLPEQKRTRAQTTAAAAADRTTKASGGDNPDETSDRSDQSPNQAEPDDSFDDFEGPRSRSKRKRASEGASAAAPTESHSLIGNFRLFFRFLDKYCFWIVFSIN